MGRILIVLKALVVILVCLPFIGRSTIPPASQAEQIRSYTRNIEFDFVNWELDAIWQKINQVALDLPDYLGAAQQHQMVIDYLNLVQKTDDLNAQISQKFSDPSVGNPNAAAEGLRQDLSLANSRLNQLAPLVETILQSQVASVAAQMGVALGGETVPPVSFHTSDPPLALIISPRSVIRQDADISLLPDLTIDQQAALEDEVSSKLNVSALVVPIGGIGLYPTMVMKTTDLNWLVETIAHEWTHNFLTLHPLGISYDASPDLRTMNETVASLSGREIGAAVIQNYYPEFVPPPKDDNPQSQTPSSPPAFNFNAQMHLTRVTADALLAAGKIDQAEQYMEGRRVFFWDHGYQIRKLNQAYFAFYGAYNDVGGGANGAAGADPVGPAVAALRSQSTTLGAFLNRIAWMTSLSQLELAVK